MLDFPYIFNNLRGAWLTMLGKSDGLSLLDISEHGFWRSFQALLVALPVMLLSWVIFGRELSAVAPLSLGQVTIRAAIVDLSAWFLPLIVLALAAKPLHLAGRFVHYVVASNWASALLLYLTLPTLVLRLVAPDAESLISLAALAFFGMALVFIFRMTHVALGQSYQMTIAVYLALLLISLLVIFGLQDLLGISYPTTSSG